MNIYVGNLSYTTSEDSLQNAFSEFGTVSSVRIVTDRATGRSKGFAFVEMPEDDEAQTAIDALNGAEVDGRMLRVNPARPKTEGGGGGPRGGGRGRGGFGGGGGGGFGGGGRQRF
ncbi:RNA-binding protein [bacterium]|nr:RNA-binding protein [candidate division CSSED10-310 bacterium]